jgi:hypothetical protein
MTVKVIYQLITGEQPLSSFFCENQKNLKDYELTCEMIITREKNVEGGRKMSLND